MEESMCRLLAVASIEEKTVEQALGIEQTNDFRELSSFHNDGWGAAWSQEGSIQHLQSIIRASDDPSFDSYAKNVTSTEQIVHLRWASKGMATTPSNSHPFVRKGYAFIHNGNIAPAKQLERYLTNESKQSLMGSTDSERFFAYILQCCDHEESAEEGLIRAVQFYGSNFPDRSLNSMILHEGKIYVINVHRGAGFDLSDYPEKKLSVPYAHNSEHYHDLMLQETDDSLIVASSGIRNGEWETLPEGHIFAIEENGGKRTITSIWERR